MIRADKGSADSGRVHIVTVVNGHVFRWGFPEGDFRSR